MTGERIRDKFAASKKKGMWMGGNVPFGYRVENRHLIIEPVEAEVLRDIYRQYLKLGNVTALRAYLESKRLRSRVNKPFSRGALYHLLTSRLYIGEIVHRGQNYPGQHPAIIDLETWNAVAEQLRSNAPRLSRPRSTTPSLLTGLVFDTAGIRYTPTHAVKNGKRYRYYTSQSLIQHQEPAGIGRIPAGELEDLVAGRIGKLLVSPDELIRVLGAAGVEDLQSTARVQAKQWSKLDASGLMQLVKPLLQRVVLRRDSVEIAVSLNRLKAAVAGEAQASEAENDDRNIRLTCRIQVRSRRGETRVLSEGEASNTVSYSPSLLKAVIRAREWYAKVTRGEIANLETIAKQNRVTSRYLRRVFRYAYLSPDIVEAIVNGQPLNLPLEKLNRRVPLDWSEQQFWVS